MSDFTSFLRSGVFLLLAVQTQFSPALGQPIDQPITVGSNPLRFTLQTASSATVLAVTDDGSLVTIREGAAPGYRNQTSEWMTRQISAGRNRLTAPVMGGFPMLSAQLETRFHDGTRGIRLRYRSHEVLNASEVPELRISLEEEQGSLGVTLHFRVYPEWDLVERWARIENRSERTVVIEKAASSSLVLPRDEYDLVHLTGRWGQEFNVERTALTGGSKVLEVRGMRFHHLSPWYLVRPSGDDDEEAGRVWFGALAWSGNWKLEFEKTPEGELQIVGGINSWDTEWTLGAGQSFETPVLVTGFCEQGPGGASRRMHHFIRRHILPIKARGEIRPVLYNSWYATTFGVSEEQQVALARTAKQIGVELFVMDDGWFKGRKDDHAGLGDWTPDEEKFPRGLNPMISAINEMEMDFGLWVEPEMVNPDSDLYRAHPDWALQTPGLKPLESRNQLVLNFARDEVRDYTATWLNKLLSENSIKFVKWDFNRDLAEVDWTGASPETARELRIRYVKNLYSVYQGLRKDFPSLLLEGCAGGGGRVDLGTLSYVDQVWTSDNTNPSDRIFIQYGFSQAYPANTMVSWTTDDDWRNARPSLEYRFRVAMAGVLGIGNDLRDWGEEEIEIAKREVARYKEIRHLVQWGDLYRLVSPIESDRSALIYVAEDRSDAVVFMYNLQDPLLGTRSATRESTQVILRGLDPDADYRFSLDSEGVYSGATLMTNGLDWLPRGDYQARMVRLERVAE